MRKLSEKERRWLARKRDGNVVRPPPASLAAWLAEGTLEIGFPDHSDDHTDADCQRYILFSRDRGTLSGELGLGDP